uniref:Reverse transcriptase RNase H-like domain-containing protein n=1 Tax=Romanomermis culicivorax TaxID=13658 RepID=A0A915K9F3_ROMCU
MPNTIITEEHKAAFEGIKTALTSSPFLCYPVYDGKAQFVIQTYTSMTPIRAILYQENRDNQWVILYNSSVLTDAETQYSTMEPECLTIVYSFRMYCHYVFSQKVMVHTNHKPLKWLKDEKHRNSRLQHLTINLQDYNHKVQYVKGKDDACADFLSRKDDPKKPLVPCTEELANKIFSSQFCSASGISNANSMVTDISLVRMSPSLKYG